MGKSKNKGKNKQAETKSEAAEKHTNQKDLKQESFEVQNKKKPDDKVTEKAAELNHKATVKAAMPPDKIPQEQNGQTDPASHLLQEPENVVDRTVAVVERSWKLWTVMGVVAAVIAVLGHVEVNDDIEELVVEKGVALTENRAKVFRTIADLSTYSKWYPGVVKFDAVDATPMGVGKYFTEVIDIPLYGEMRYSNVVTGYESPRYVSFLSDSWMAMRIEIEVHRRESEHTPTGIKYRVYAQAKSYLSRYVALPAMKMMYNNRVRQAMFNLRYMFDK